MFYRLPPNQGHLLAPLNHTNICSTLWSQPSCLALVSRTRPVTIIASGPWLLIPDRLKKKKKLEKTGSEKQAMLKLKQLKCNDIFHADSQHANGQPVLIFCFFFRLWSCVFSVSLIGPDKQVAYGSGVLGNRNAFSTRLIENNKPEDKGKLNSFKKQCCAFLL